MKSRIKPKDFYAFLNNSKQNQVANLSQWKKYHRNYITQAGFLKQNSYLTYLQYQGYYWYGIPKTLRSIIEVRLQVRLPSYDNSQPWPIALVQGVTESYFKQSKYTSQLPHLYALGLEEEDDEDSDSDNSDLDDSDEYKSDQRHRRHKYEKKKSRSRSTYDLPPPTQVRFEEPSQNILPPTQHNEIPVDDANRPLCL